MSKRLRQNIWLYVAPQIKGKFDNHGTPIVYDEKTKKHLDPSNIDDKVFIYERQVNGWFLNHAARLKKSKYAGFIILMLGISYIEGVEQYREGQESRNNSSRFFKKGLKRIFNLNNIPEYKLSDFYHHARCGLFHTGMTRDKITINGSLPETIDFTNDDEIKINQIKFINTIKAEFKSYITELKNQTNTTLRTNFNQMFTIL
ncbi:MAG: hypothetical protein KAJ18_05720 [Candidatus Omnitrophica bacterium]|nr:hypothetical protein [Candidatus Omnitrophota bacterium]